MDANTSDNSSCLRRVKQGNGPAAFDYDGVNRESLPQSILWEQLAVLRTSPKYLQVLLVVASIIYSIIPLLQVAVLHTKLSNWRFALLNFCSGLTSVKKTVVASNVAAFKMVLNSEIMLAFCDFTFVSHPKAYVAQILILNSFCSNPRGLVNL